MRGLAIIFVFQLAGEVLVTLTGIPFPGPVLGLLLLWLALARGWVSAESVESTAGFLLQNLTLFFTPIVVGAVVYREFLADHWLAIGLGLILSTAVGLLVTGSVAQWLEKVRSR
ncbi:MAG: CidA/LrgA family protein [Firmicutes bacterium]|nr:CidA/LrgA family protein [Bacillota bacterium]